VPGAVNLHIILISNLNFHLYILKINMSNMTSPVRPEWYVIVNPNAGNGKGRKDWSRISELFVKKNIIAVPGFTENKGHAISLARSAVEKGFRKIITVGGDGTLNEIVNGVMTQEACSSQDVCIAILPVGTGNDWGRMFGIPLIYEGAADVIAGNKQMLHDIGLVKYHIGDEQHSRYFINIAGLGFEATVVKRSNRHKDRGRSNKAIYFYTLLTSLVSYKRVNADIDADGVVNRSNIFSLNVGNGRYCGGGMRQTPDAIPDDGLLDVTVIRNMGRLEIIRNLKLLYDGTILSHPKVDGYRVKNLKVVPDDLLYAEADGESLGHTPAEFSIIPAAIRIVYGNRLIT
jgi:YegS/Rv2252/BmrU family lipid kinase